jgi:ABC-type ATPase with predicted acetyltransferase domain
MPVYSLHRTFRSKSPDSPRTRLVRCYFGLTAETAQDHCDVLSGVRVPVSVNRIIFVSGPSGAGKTVLLSALQKKLGKVIDINTIQLPQRRAVIDCFLLPLEETLGILVMFGLGDAHLYIRRVGHLSEGQQFRLRLAIAFAGAIEGKWQYILADEFCNSLDSLTASLISRNLRRWVDSGIAGVTIICASSREDFLPALEPDLLFLKKFESPWQTIEYRKTRPDFFPQSVNSR